MRLCIQLLFPKSKKISRCISPPVSVAACSRVTASSALKSHSVRAVIIWSSANSLTLRRHPFTRQLTNLHTTADSEIEFLKNPRLACDKSQINLCKFMYLGSFFKHHFDKFHYFSHFCQIFQNFENCSVKRSWQSKRVINFFHLFSFQPNYPSGIQ